MAEGRRSPQAPASGPRLLLGSGDLVGSGRGMDVIHVGMGSIRTGQGPAETVVHALARIGDEGDTLPKQSRLCELACLQTPTADGVARLLGFRGIDAQQADT